MLPPPGYRDVELTGVGATSRVFRAVDARIDHVVALKRLHRSLVGSPDALARLRREYRALAALHHRAIVPVRDIITWGGDPTVVMDFVPGIDLKEYLQEHGPLDVERAMEIAKILLDVMAVVHGAGIVHRDIKPQNVRLAEDGRIFLLDFGSARLDAASQLTQTGTSVGTPDYMAPELFAGPAYDPRVDLYGVGATLFEALTGRAPQIADTLTELAFKRSREAVVPVRTLRPDVPAGLAQVVDRCLMRRPDDRYASATLARFALEHPAVELSFQKRRAQHPPCLHCKTPIDPDSGVCPACGSDHPFSFAAGSHHVVVHNVRSPERFLDLVTERFPERTRRPDFVYMSQRLAALNEESQRLVSYVDEAEARALADDLEAADVQCEVVEDEGTAGWRLYGWSAALFMVAAVVLGSWVLDADIGFLQAGLLVLPAVMALGTERLWSVGQAAQGILSSGRYPAAVTPKLRGGLALSGTGLLAAGAAAPSAATFLSGTGLAAAAGTIGALHMPLLVGAASALGASAIAWWASYSMPSRIGRGTPEPGLKTKLRQAFSPPASLSRGHLRAETAVFLTATVLALVPVEWAGLASIRAAVPPISAVVTPALPKAPQAPLPQGPVSEAPPSSIDPSPVRSEAPPSTPDGRLLARLKAISPSQAPVTPRWAYGLGGLFALWGLFMAGYIERRRRTVYNEGQELFTSLDQTLLRPGRAVPRRDALPDGRAADAIARTGASDPFVSGARVRAADLAHCLPPESVERLKRAVDRLSETVRDRPAAERSALARAIMETDPEQRLRFDLLALEGQMEKAAAMRWYETLEDEDAA